MLSVVSVQSLASPCPSVTSEPVVLFASPPVYVAIFMLLNAEPPVYAVPLSVHMANHAL